MRASPHRGGAKETVLGLHPGSSGLPEDSTGMFFHQQSVDSLLEAILAFEQVEDRFDPFFIQRQADRFAPEHFRHSFGRFLGEKWEEFHNHF